jgi:carboxymethylenebutenolidase
MCYDDEARPPTPPGSAGAVTTSEFEITAADGNQAMAFLALPEAPPKAQILILPDIRGLHTFYKELASRFAEVGIAALAIDYFGRTAGSTSRAEGFDFWPHVHQMTIATALADIRAGLAALQAHAGPGQAFTVGFCLGGTISFLSGANDLGLTGVIGFYSGLSRPFGGGQPLLEQANTIRTPALGLFGGADQGIPPEQVEQFDALLDQAGVEHHILIYPGAPHSFFDRRAEEFASDSADAWAQVLGFIQKQTAHTSHA